MVGATRRYDHRTTAGRWETVTRVVDLIFVTQFGGRRFGPVELTRFNFDRINRIFGFGRSEDSRYRCLSHWPANLRFDSPFRQDFR